MLLSHLYSPIVTETAGETIQFLWRKTLASLEKSRRMKQPLCISWDIPEFSTRIQQVVQPGLLSPHLLDNSHCNMHCHNHNWDLARKASSNTSSSTPPPPPLSLTHTHTTHFHSNRVTSWIQFLSYIKTSELKGIVSFLPISNTNNTNQAWRHMHAYAQPQLGPTEYKVPYFYHWVTGYSRVIWTISMVAES